MSSDAETDADAVARRAAAAMYERDTAARGLGITLGDVGPGRAVMQMTVTGAMLNGHDVCHGGFIFTLADTTFHRGAAAAGPPYRPLRYLRHQRGGPARGAVPRAVVPRRWQRDQGE